LLIFCLVITGCGDPDSISDENIQCSDELPDTWGCDEVNGKYVCDKDKEFSLFQDTMGSINRPIKNTIETLTVQVLESPFSRVVHAMLLLYIAIYGVMLAGGLVNISLSDAIIRLMKIVVISLMFTEVGIQLYFDLVVKFAIDGGMELLNWVSSKIGTAIGEINTLDVKHEEIKTLLSNIKTAKTTVTVDKPLNSGAFVAIDHVLGQLISPRSLALYTALILTLSATKIFIGICLLFASIFFILAIFRAVYIYIVSVLGRIFLLGIGGIFVIFLLFRRTQQIFLQKWFQQLLGYMFAPIFVFTFISLMALLVNITFLDIFKDANGDIKYKVCREDVKKTEMFNSISTTWEFRTKDGNTWTNLAKEDKSIHLEFFSAMVLLLLSYICWNNIPSLDGLATQLFGVMPELGKVGQSTTKSLDLRSNLGGASKRVGKGAMRTGGRGLRAGASGAKKAGGAAKKVAQSAKHKWNSRKP